MRLRKRKPRRSRKTPPQQCQSSSKTSMHRERSREERSSKATQSRENAAEAEVSKAEIVSTVETRRRETLQRMSIANLTRRRVRKSIMMRALIVNAQDQDLESVFIILICYKISIIERRQLLTCQQPFSSRSWS